MAVILLATLDTKGAEIGFIRDLLKRLSIQALVVDVGTSGNPAIEADIPRERLLSYANVTLEKLRTQGDRGYAVGQAAIAARNFILEYFKSGQVEGVLAIGGSAGTTIGTAAMRALPLGIPKLMVSTLASGQVRPFIGSRDIMMVHSVVDISGINRISRRVLGNAAHAMAGMIINGTPVSKNDKPMICATMFGVTTPCVESCRKLIESAGYEMLVFHATGTGGEAMEALIEDRLIEGVLDITTTELADELVGGILTAGPNRLTAASKIGVPQVISVGALDMVNFGPLETVPPRFANRKFHVHNQNVTLMRTTPEENTALGKLIAAKASSSTGPVAIVLPLGGISAIDKPGESFHDLAADNALFESIRQHVSPNVKLLESPHHINDPEFSELLVRTLLELKANPSSARG